MTNVDDAAIHLLEIINVPVGGISVSVWYKGDRPIIKVCPKENFYYIIPKSPKEIDGYEIQLCNYPFVSMH